MRGARKKQPGLRPHAVQYAAGSIIAFTWRPGGTWPRLHARKSVDFGWCSVVSPTHARRCGVASHRFRSHEKAALDPAVRYHWWGTAMAHVFFFSRKNDGAKRVIRNCASGQVLIGCHLTWKRQWHVSKMPRCCMNVGHE
jgi:hypothetical protein